MVIDRGVRPRRARRLDRLLLVMLSWFFDWRSTLVVLRPATLIRWQRDLVRCVWQWKSRPTGRPQVPLDLRVLIRRMATENPSWGCRRIADELRMKLGISLSARTVRKHLPKGTGRGDEEQSKLVDLRAEPCPSHRGLRLRRLDDGIVPHGLHTRGNGDRFAAHPPRHSTPHPTAAWTTQQLREVFVPEHPWRYLLHDRDAIFSSSLDETARSFGLSVLKSPPRCPKANASCERLIGTIRRECLDWIIPLGEGHLRAVIREWAAHYNRARPHSALRSVPSRRRELPPSCKLIVTACPATSA
ncbi:MAG TPA: integrase core domain-containing protein [Thermoanaerobaculia bacterium]|nr:integrase core domain-containing protein [Thermoanaerobaculia bacterium]